MMKLAGLVLVGSALMLWACGGGDESGGGRSSDAADGEMQATAQIQADEGGRLAMAAASGWSASVEIPAGALGADAELTVRELASEDFPGDLVDGVSSRAFEVLGADGPLGEPATIAVNFPANDVPVVEASLLVTVDADGAIEPLADLVTTVAADGSVTVSGTTTHFSPFMGLEGRGRFHVGWTTQLEQMHVGESGTATIIALAPGLFTPRYLRSNEPCTRGALLCASAEDQIPFERRPGPPPAELANVGFVDQVWELGVTWVCDRAGDDEYVARVSSRLPAQDFLDWLGSFFQNVEYQPREESNIQIVLTGDSSCVAATPPPEVTETPPPEPTAMPTPEVTEPTTGVDHPPFAAGRTTDGFSIAIACGVIRGVPAGTTVRMTVDGAGASGLREGVTDANGRFAVEVGIFAYEPFEWEVHELLLPDGTLVERVTGGDQIVVGPAESECGG